MEQLKKKLDDHVADDRAEFMVVNSKLDRLIIDVATIKGQWKLVGAIIGTLAGLATGWLWG